MLHKKEAMGFGGSFTLKLKIFSLTALTVIHVSLKHFFKERKKGHLCKNMKV